MVISMYKLELIALSIILLLTNSLLYFLKLDILIIIIFLGINLIYFFLYIKIINRRNNLKDIIKQGNEILKGNYNKRILSRDNEKISDLIEILNELTELLQQEIIKSKKHEEVRKRLLSNISHDIRTPLTSILGYIEVLKEDESLDEKKKNEYYDILIQKAKNLKTIIDELFEISKLESDDIKLEFKIYDITEVLRETLINYLPVINKKELEMNIDIPDKEYKVYADKLHLERAIGNIIKNSIQYGKNGGKIEVNFKEEEKNYRINISDYGRGIKKEKIPLLFERLYKGDHTRNTNNQNTGLGLAISKNIIQKHNGKIEVDSILNQKTTFSIILPKL